MLRSLAEALEAGQLFSARPAAHQPADADFGVPPAHPAPALRHPSLRDAPGHVANNHGTCLLLRSPPRELQTNPESTSPPLPGAGLGQRAQLPGSTALRCPVKGAKPCVDGKQEVLLDLLGSSLGRSTSRSRAGAHPAAPRVPGGLAAAGTQAAQGCSCSLPAGSQTANGLKFWLENGFCCSVVVFVVVVSPLLALKEEG